MAYWALDNGQPVELAGQSNRPARGLDQRNRLVGWIGQTVKEASQCNRPASWTEQPSRSNIHRFAGFVYPCDRGAQNQDPELPMKLCSAMAAVAQAAYSWLACKSVSNPERDLV